MKATLGPNPASGYNRPEEQTMAIPLELTDAQEERLRSEAQRLGVTAEDLARLAVEDLLERPGDDFRNAADIVMEKNRELYKRLS